MEPNSPNKKNEPSAKDKLAETFEKLKQEGLYTYAKSNTRDTIAYILLVIGLILLFFAPFWGGLLIGVVIGLYFANEILSVLTNINDFIDRQGLVKSLILAALALAFFIAAPAIFIGAALTVLARFLLADKK